MGLRVVFLFFGRFALQIGVFAEVWLLVIRWSGRHGEDGVAVGDVDCGRD